jgi:hypothetical protein
MAKLLKILLQFIGGVSEWLLIFLIFLAFAVRTSSFQTYLAQKATAFLSDELNTKIFVDKVDIQFFNRAELKGVLVLDLKKNTLASLKSAVIKFRIKDFDLKNNVFVINEIKLNQGNIHVYQDKDKGEFNFQFLSDYFASTDTTASAPMELNLKNINLSQINLKFDDYRVAPTKFGMDYSHLAITDLNLDASLKLLKNGGITTNIKSLNLKDQSGLEIDKFASKLTFDSKGLQMNNFRLYTPNSKIYFAKLNLLTPTPNAFAEFVDEVVFDVDLRKSLISLKDVSYFVPDMEGMDQKVLLATTISKRIKDLRLEELELRTGKNTQIIGTINLPDFRKLEKSNFDEKLALITIDLKDIEQIKMPKSSSESYLKFDPTVTKFGTIKIKDLHLYGSYASFILKSDFISTSLGTIELDNGIAFKEHKNRDGFSFMSAIENDYTVQIDTFQLGKMLDDKTIGSLSGQFKMRGDIFSNGKLDFTFIEGGLNQLTYQGYQYQSITLSQSSFIDNVFIGKIEIKDKNIDLSFDGFLNLGKKQHFNFSLAINQAILDNLYLSNIDTNIIKSTFNVDLSGTNPNNYSGNITLHNLFYQEGSKKFDIPSMVLNMNRSNEVDELSIRSNVADIYLKGKINFVTIGADVMNQFNKILPAIFKQQKVKPSKDINRFEYNLLVKNSDDILNLFAPDIMIANGSSISGKFDQYIHEFELNVYAPLIKYDKNIVIKNLNGHQLINDSILEANYSISKLQLNDSLKVDQVTFKATGTNDDEIDSDLKWNASTNEESHFSWKTIINDVNSYFFNINPSYFSAKGHRWEINENSQVLLAPNDIQIQNFKMQREQQFLTIDGCISEQDEDVLKVVIKDLELEDFNNLIGTDIQIKGNLNGVAMISDPFQNIDFTSDVKIKELFIDGAEVGDINVKAAWGKKTESIDLSGELFYKKNKTFNFDGNYYLNRKENLNFNLNFDYTDIQFTNAFMDPQVLSGIRGLVDGGVKITGSSDNPIVQGEINLLSGNAKVEMFGVNFGFDGKIKIEKDGIFIDNMPIMDEDANSGTIVATVFHNNFSDWTFDVSFNLEDDAYIRGQSLPRFLVMNTKYKEGDIYYGKAYVTGYANIFGSSRTSTKMKIDVNLETKKGSQIFFPMFGSSDLTEEQIITFVSRDTVTVKPPKIDFSGIDLALNFKVTPDAQLKIIFDENLGDEITAFGIGNIAMNMDNIGDLSMIGVFEITKGSVYNFAMGPIKQPFYIEEGGNISWTGDPVNAQLNLKTYNLVRTSLSDIMPSVEEDAVYPVQDVKCYLNLSQTLNDPLITFDIEVPKATENDKAALNRVKGDKDELNKQFFSLLLVKKFQPIHGTLSAGAGAGLDLVSGQLNDMLNKVSTDVKFNVALANSKDAKSAELGLQKSLLNDRLILKGSLGVENSSAGNQHSNSLIGDVNVEYLINEKGTFRVSIFNESNDNTVIQEKSQGPFTQGAGLNYQEEFNNFNDFQLVQYALDVFRKPEKKKYPIKRKRKQKEIPQETVPNAAVKPEE